MGRPVRVSQKRGTETKAGRAIYAPDYFCAHLPEHKIGDQNRHRVARRAALARGRVLVPLFSRLQHERGRVGWPHRPGRIGCGNGSHHVALP